ncbi:hypothetical protein KR093_002455 [Drosophila rubida]|uniref:Uncharacterized protein n=1 Tax=Drosophila rubida TaxID=30044 RepID=A0AAD4PQG1_9MUSC|nr:hypothetical protein KR093_002455 [Drosophila rubida]
MAEGFKKYFNGTTISGRANVAKATYATLAVLYLLYRVRRGKGTPKQQALAEKDQCSCDGEKPDPPNSYCEPSESQQPQKDCSVCRDRANERRPRDEGCKSDPPPPPPSSGSSAGGPRRKCPCEDPHRHIETPKQTTHQSSMRQACQEDQVHPAREIIGHMQEAASRALRNVIGAVMGDPAISPAASGNSTKGLYEEENECNAAAAAAASAAAAAAAAAAATAGAAAAAAAETLNAADHIEDDGSSDYTADNPVLGRQRRTAPRACVPTTGNSREIDLVVPIEQDTQEFLQPQPQSQSQSRFRGFDDDFASEMFFEDFDE